MARPRDSSNNSTMQQRRQPPSPPLANRRFRLSPRLLLASSVAAAAALLVVLLPAPVLGAAAVSEEDVPEKVRNLAMAMVPKFDGVLVFDMAFSGAVAAYRELGEPGELEYIAPDGATDSGAAQIDIVQRLAQTGFNTVLLSNNADNDIAPACVAAEEEGTSVVTWDSPIPTGTVGGEKVFVAQVDFDETGKVMADMTLQILGEEGGKFVILSASAKASNQNAWNQAMQDVMAADPLRYGNLELVDIVYGNDEADLSYELAETLMDTYPDLKLIMSPTTIGIASAAQAVTDRGKCGSLKVSGLGLPSEMVQYTLSGCAPLFALWSFVDLGYLTYYTAYRFEAGEIQITDGETFEAGRLGTMTIERDPTREDESYRIIMGSFTVYDKENIENAVFFDAIQGDGGQDSFEQRYIDKYKKKAIAILPKVTGLISFFFSGYIVWHVLRKPSRRKATKNRILVGISIHDMIGAFFGFFLSTWPIPADTWLVWGAAGTVESCTMQGFFFQAGIGAAPLYSAALTTFYFLNVVFEWSTATIVKRAEPYLHAIPILFGWGTAIAGLPLTLYNAADRVGFMCWIAEYPAYCSLRDSCERGKNADLYRWAFLYGWVFAVLGYMTICMSWIYYKVLSAEKATDRWQRASGQRRRRRLSKRVAFQGLQYTLAFIFPWIFGITVSVMKGQTYGDLSTTARLDNIMTILEVINSIIWPLKGFFTFIAYMRPKWKGGRPSTSGRRSTSSPPVSGGEESNGRTRGRQSIMTFKSFLTPKQNNHRHMERKGSGFSSGLSSGLSQGSAIESGFYSADFPDCSSDFDTAPPPNGIKTGPQVEVSMLGMPPGSNSEEQERALPAGSNPEMTIEFSSEFNQVQRSNSNFSDTGWFYIDTDSGNLVSFFDIPSFQEIEFSEQQMEDDDSVDEAEEGKKRRRNLFDC